MKDKTTQPFMEYLAYMTLLEKIGKIHGAIMNSLVTLQSTAPISKFVNGACLHDIVTKITKTLYNKVSTVIIFP